MADRPHGRRRARGSCSECHYWFNLRADGTVPMHNLGGRARDMGPCDGAGKQPAEVVA